MTLKDIFLDLCERYNLQTVTSRDDGSSYFVDNGEYTFSYTSDLEDRIEMVSFQKLSKVLISKMFDSDIYSLQIQVPARNYYEEIAKLKIEAEDDSDENELCRIFYDKFIKAQPDSTEPNVFIVEKILYENGETVIKRLIENMMN